MNGIDAILIVLIAVNVFNGARRGFVRCLFDFCAVIISIICAVRWYIYQASFLINNFNWQQWPAYLTTFLCIWVCLFWITNQVGHMIHSMVRATFFSPFDIAAGMLFGFFKGMVYIFLIFIPLSFLPFLPTSISLPLKDSIMVQTSGQWFEGAIPYIEDYLKKDQVKSNIQQLVPALSESEHHRQDPSF